MELFYTLDDQLDRNYVRLRENKIKYKGISYDTFLLKYIFSVFKCCVVVDSFLLVTTEIVNLPDLKCLIIHKKNVLENALEVVLKMI